jgi:cyclopropane fatty-acyl-phospholipid synthase-like methyltransferase
VTTTWREYFDGLKDQSPLYREQAALYVKSLCAAVGLQQHQRVLDFGCGFGFVAALLTPLVAEVWWWDPSPNMRSVAERNTADFPNARFCDLSAMPLTAPEGSDWRGSPFDVILINSVAQYMAPEELCAWLRKLGSMLAPEGKLVLSDLIPPHHSGLSDLAHLLRFGLRHGSPLRAANGALGGVANYWRTSRALPLTRIGREDLARWATAASLDVTFLPANLTHFRQRWTAVLRPRSRQR